MVLTVFCGGIISSGCRGGGGAVRVAVVDGRPCCCFHHQRTRVNLRVLRILFGLLICMKRQYLLHSDSVIKLLFH